MKALAQCMNRRAAGCAGAPELGQAQGVFDIDIEHCPNCGGSLKVIAAPSTRLRTGIEDPPVIVKILAHLRLPTNQFALASIPIRGQYIANIPA